MIYESKPHTIEAFQFTDIDQDFPEWFKCLPIINKAAIHHDERNGHHLILRSRKGQREVVYINDWVCKTEHGKIYALDDENFNNSFYTEEINND